MPTEDLMQNLKDSLDVVPPVGDPEEVPVELPEDAPDGSVYVVQRETSWDEEPDDPRPVWEDIATVAVPPRTKRGTVIKQALAQAGLVPTRGMEPLKLRVLDVDSAEVVIARDDEVPEPPAPSWAIG